jgi:transposase-like protein
MAARPPTGVQEANRTGGTHTHKPECGCYPCKARRRKEETLALANRVPEPTQEVATKGYVINADMPLVTKKRSPKNHVAEWVAMRAVDPDLTVGEVAKRLGLSAAYLQNTIRQAAKEGWLVFEDPISQLEFEITPKVIRNLHKFLDEGDRQVTIETAKGTLFKQYQEAKGVDDAPKTILALRIEQPDTNHPIKVVSGTIVGKPRQLAEVSSIDRITVDGSEG